MDWLSQAQTYLDQRQYSLARERIEKIGDEPLRKKQLAKAFALEGATYLNDGNFDLARRSYEQALEADPASEAYAGEMGWKCFMLGRRTDDAQKKKEYFGRAEQSYKATLAANPTSLIALEYLGKLEAARGNVPASAQNFKKIIEIDPNGDRAAKARAQLRDMGLKY